MPSQKHPGMNLYYHRRFQQVNLGNHFPLATTLGYHLQISQTLEMATLTSQWKLTTMEVWMWTQWIRNYLPWWRTLVTVVLPMLVSTSKHGDAWFLRYSAHHGLRRRSS